MMCGEGDSIPVSQMPVDGTFPNGTSQYEKRNLALDLPEWDPTLCIQCGKCTAVCPHAVIRSKFFSPDALANAPEGFECLDAKHPDWKGEKFVIQISPNDCTGCTLCADVCPAKSKTDPTHKALTMVPAGKIHDKEEANWNFFLSLPDVDRTKVRTDNIRSMQVLRPLFEFSGACAGCGETPYVKMLSQLFGNRLVVANATGCSSIYGGNLPTTPWSHDSEGRGPAWANSLFEDNAEFVLASASLWTSRWNTPLSFFMKLPAPWARNWWIGYWLIRRRMKQTSPSSVKTLKNSRRKSPASRNTRAS